MAGEAKFYVYILFRPDGTPCYVGKGKGARWLQHEWYGELHQNKKLAAIMYEAGRELPKIKIREHLTHEHALEIESALIRAIGRIKNGGPLVNLNDGGEGQIGWVPSAETRARIGAANKGRRASEETRRKMSAASKGKPKSPEHAANVAKGLRGKPKSASHRKKLSQARQAIKGQVSDKIARYHAEMTNEQKAERSKKISIATKARMADPEIRAKFEAAIAGRDNSQMHLHFKGKSNG